MYLIDFSEDKAQLSKLVEAVKTNFNDRADEVRNWHLVQFRWYLLKPACNLDLNKLAS